MFSNPPRHGAAIVVTVLQDPELYALWRVRRGASRCGARARPVSLPRCSVLSWAVACGLHVWLVPRRFRSATSWDATRVLHVRSVPRSSAKPRILCEDVGCMPPSRQCPAPVRPSALSARPSGAQTELKGMADRINGMRKRLFEELQRVGAPGRWNHIVEQIGMFSYTGLTKARSGLADCMPVLSRAQHLAPARMNDAWWWPHNCCNEGLGAAAGAVVWLAVGS
jgi:hypothetical protein